MKSDIMITEKGQAVKVYISADIEGTTGISHWNEAEENKTGYDAYAKMMTLEMAAACEGALNAGAREVVVKDAHWTARNINPEKLPHGVQLIRGWSGHPCSMVQELDDSFDALVMTGYHSGASTAGHPLAHTLTGQGGKITLNGETASEYLLNRNVAAMHGVPSVFISGDKLLCETVKTVDINIHTVATMEGIGGSTMAVHPAEIRDKIRAGVEAALKDKTAMAKPGVLDDHFTMEVDYINHENAYSASFYPGARSSGPHSIVFETSDFFEIMRALQFVVK